MTPERWEHIKGIFYAALEREPSERSRFLDAACAGDEGTEQEVSKLISAYEKSGQFLDFPAFDVVAREPDGAEPARLTEGQTVGHYRVVSLLGAGGMGEVYLAEDTRLGRRVALKLLPAHSADDRERLDRFKREAVAASRLNHPNILTIYEIGADGGRHFIAAELVEGVTLREHLRATGPGVTDTLDIGAQVAAALAAAHQAGIVHRDIKPENVMLRPDALVKVLDFGLAKLVERKVPAVDTEAPTRALACTDPGMIMGTVAYMSPEQARGLAVDARTDIWSLGVLLYEMIAERAPFEGLTTSDVIVSVLEREPPLITSVAPQTPQALEWIVTKALTKERAGRYQTAAEMLADLRRLKRRFDLDAERERLVPPDAPAAGAGRGAQPSLRSTAEVGGASRATSPRRTSSVRAALAWSGRSKSRTAAALASVVILATAAAVFLRWPGERAAGPVAAGEIHTIAILPLANLSGDPAQEYFADGMTDELITVMAKLADVQVISRGSVMRFKNSTIPVPEIARQLGADAVLTGSVVRAGDRARITVQLIRAATDRHLWAESYERDLRDVLLLQRDIALNVGQQISARVAGQQRLAARGRQMDPAAHEAYLKGLYYSNKATPESKTKALDYFSEATKISPFYPEAHANIADCYLSLGGWYAVEERDEALAKARAAVTEALRQDEALAEAHVALGDLSQEYEWDWSAAEREFRRAVELNPSYAAAHLALAKHLLLVGRLDEVPAEVERARSADPLSLSDVGVGAWTLEYSGHHQEAVNRMKMVVQMDPNIPVTQFLFGLVYMDGGELDKAADQFRTAIRMYPAFGKFKAHLAFVLHARATGNRLVSCSTS